MINNQYDIESTIVSSLLKRPELLEKLRVKPYMFQNEEFKSFIKYVMVQGKVDHHELYRKTMQDDNFVKSNTLSDLYNSDFIGDGFFERYQQDLLMNYQLVKANELMNTYRQEPTNKGLNILVEELKSLTHITDEDTSGTSKFIEEYVEELYSDEPTTIIKTGYKLLDYKIGGFEPSQLVIIAARPSMGKTAFTLNMLLNIASSGVKTSLFSLETNGKSIITRLISTLTGIELEKVKRIKDLTPDDITQLTSALDKILKMRIDISDKSSITTQDIRSVAMKYQNEQHVIFIDYLQLMKTDSKIDRRVAVEEISRELKIIANETGAIIVLLSQLNRNVESRQDKRPMLSDMKESGGIEADASIAMMLYREDYYENDKADDVSGKSNVEVNIAKNKDGETGVVPFEFFKKSQRFFT